MPRSTSTRHAPRLTPDSATPAPSADVAELARVLASLPPEQRDALLALARGLRGRE